MVDLAWVQAKVRWLLSMAGSGHDSLACAGQAVKPEDASLILPLNPCPYFLEHVDAGAAEASRFMSLIRRVEGRLGSVR